MKSLLLSIALLLITPTCVGGTYLVQKLTAEESEEPVWSYGESKMSTPTPTWSYGKSTVR